MAFNSPHEKDGVVLEEVAVENMASLPNREVVVLEESVCAAESVLQHKGLTVQALKGCLQ